MKNKFKLAILSSILCSTIGSTAVLSMEDNNSIKYDGLAAGSCPSAASIKTISDATLSVTFAKVGIKLHNCIEDIRFGKNNRDRASVIPSKGDKEPLKLIFVYVGNPTDSVFEFSTRPLTQTENFSSSRMNEPHVFASVKPVISSGLYNKLIYNPILAKNLTNNNVTVYHFGYGVEGSARAILSMMYAKKHFSDHNYVVTFGSSQPFNPWAIRQVASAGAQIIHIYNENDPAFYSHFNKSTISTPFGRLPGEIYLFKSNLTGNPARAWEDNYEDFSEESLRNVRYKVNKHAFRSFKAVHRQPQANTRQSQQDNIGGGGYTSGASSSSARPNTSRTYNRHSRSNIFDSFQKECNEDQGFKIVANAIGTIGNLIATSANSNEDPYFSDDKDLEFTSSDDSDNDSNRRNAELGNLLGGAITNVASSFWGAEAGENVGNALRGFFPNNNNQD